MEKSKRQLRDTWSQYYDESTRTYRIPGELLTGDDEQPDGDAIEERNHLIAKARNSFKSLADNTSDADMMRKGCRAAAERMDEEMKCMGIASDGRSIEPTNGIADGTNGITLVEGDVLDLMHKAADELHAVDYVRLTVDASDTSDMFAKLADMVERDYVPRENYRSNMCRLNADWRELHAQVMSERNHALAERDEWKAKAEGKSKGRAGQSNLEWLWESDPDFIADWVSKASYCRYCAFEDDCDGSLGDDDPKCYRGNLEWLLSEHVDANDGLQPENGVTRDKDGANDGNANLGTDLGTSEPEIATVTEVDSREKLEADAMRVAELLWADGWCYRNDELTREPIIREEKIIELLDRQAAITEWDVRTDLNREDFELIQWKIDGKQAIVDRLQRENMALARDLGECMAMRDELREKLGKAVMLGLDIAKLRDLKGDAR